MVKIVKLNSARKELFSDKLKHNQKKLRENDAPLETTESGKEEAS